MDDTVLINEVLELTLAIEQGDATQVQRARLERIFEDRPAAIPWYLRVVDDSIALRKVTDPHTQDVAPDNGLLSGELGLSARLGRWKSLHRAGVFRWFVAASLLIAAVAASWWTGQDRAFSPTAEVPRNSQFTQVVSISNVIWSEGSQRFDEWSLVSPGDVLRFDAGMVSLFLANGVELRVEGPADFELVSHQKLLVHEGKLAARVGPRALGFSIETPHANVIDRGTSFGLSVSKDCRTAVVVYEGVVDLDVLGDQSQPRRRLATGEALSVDRDGHLSRITMVQSADFLEPARSANSKSSQDRLIRSVSDNVQSLMTAKYYRIIPRGFSEDCRAYVDRLHEWNGVDQRGLPAFLLGGDYVMMFNDDKIATEIEVAVEVQQPANLYVLIDDRVPPPAWLTEGFVDTRWDIGSDDGWPDQIIDTAIGAGQSIDHVCSVWRREVKEPSTVVLGALSTEEPAAGLDVEWSMYGIVATPFYPATTVASDE